jgi:hypothetical protein
MPTIYLGGSHISYENPRLSGMREPAEVTEYFEQREIWRVPTLAMVAAALVGLLTLCSFFGNDASQTRPDTSPRYAAYEQPLRQPGLAGRVGKASEILLPSKGVERPERSSDR